MNSILVRAEELDNENILQIAASKLEESLGVKPTVGMRVRIGLLGEKRAFASISQIKGDLAVVEITSSEPAPPRSEIVVIIAVPRPQTVRKVIHYCTTLGIKELIFVRSSESEKSYLSSHALQREFIDLEVKKGLEQAFDVIGPTVTIKDRFKPFVEDELAARMKANSKATGIVLHTTSNAEPLGKFVLDRKHEVFAAIGPESGWSEYEVNRFAEIGFKTVTLGTRLLRVEAATCAAIAGIQAIQNRRDSLTD